MVIQVLVSVRELMNIINQNNMQMLAQQRLYKSLVMLEAQLHQPRIRVT